MASIDECNKMNDAVLFIPVIKTEIKEEVEDSTLVLNHHAASISDSKPHSSQQISQSMQLSFRKKHCCEVCGKMFLRVKTLKRHSVKHMVQKHYKCSICSLSFTRNYLLLRHIKTHSHINLSSTSCISASEAINIVHEKRVAFNQSSKAVVSYGCPICSEKFPRIMMVNKHASIHSVEMPFKCRLCIKRFSAENDLLVHALEVHGDKEPFGCYCCSEKFGLHALMEKHLLEHSEDIQSRDEGGQKRHRCQFCMKCFKKSAYLVSHVKNHLRERPYQCHMCSKAFKWQKVLNQHYKTHTGEKTYNCGFCECPFIYKSQLTKHIRSQHTDTTRNQTEDGDITRRDYRCALCSKSYMDKSGLRQHLRTHLEGHKCMFCEKVFCRYVNLVEHIRVHTGEKPYTCQYCQFFSCSRRKTLLRHERESHGKQEKKSYKCPHCSRSFCYLFYLQGHLKREHEHRCPVCQQSLTSSEELKVHMNEHTRERNKCQVCGMTFMSEFGLTLHVRIHTGEKQLKCIRCKVLRIPAGMKQKPCVKCVELNKGTSAVPASVMSASVVIETKPDIKCEN